MPIGAAIGGAVIGAGGSIIAGSKSASAQKQAAQTAANSAQSTTDANNQLFRDTRAQNIAIAQPFYNNGVASGNALQDLLLGSHAAPTGQTNPGYRDGSALGGVDWSQYISSQPDVANDYRLHQDMSPAEYGPWHYAQDGSRRDLTPYEPQVTVPTQAAGSTGSALDAFDKFRGGTNYQWRYDQGLKATEGNFATKGALDSGAAEKAKITFGQNFASNELSNYMNLLAGQQNVGLSAGNAIMGVGTSAANAIAGQNTNAGNVAANAALTSGQANANMWGTVGQTAGQLGGALFQYGMGGVNQPSVNFGSSALLSQQAPVSLSSTPYTPQPVNWGF
jgi:hypothetical protein